MDSVDMEVNTHLLTEVITSVIKSHLPQPESVVPMDKAFNAAGIGKSTGYALIKKGDFPQPVSLPSAQGEARRKGIIQSELSQWIQDRIEERNAN